MGDEQVADVLLTLQVPELVACRSNTMALATISETRIGTLTEDQRSCKTAWTSFR